MCYLRWVALHQERRRCVLHFSHNHSYLVLSIRSSVSDSVEITMASSIRRPDYVVKRLATKDG